MGDDNASLSPTRTSAAAATTSAAELTDLNPPRGTPAALKNSFWTSLSWIIATVREGGWTITRPSTRASAAVLTCSISTVITSHFVASSSIAASSVNGATMCSSATQAAGQSEEGSTMMTRIPSGRAAIASMRPSCPPPSIPMRTGFIAAADERTETLCTRSASVHSSARGAS